MYKKMANIVDSIASITFTSKTVERLTDNAFIPFDPANTDYQKFKVDVADGVELQDPEGNVMTQEQVDEFLKTIP